MLAWSPAAGKNEIATWIELGPEAVRIARVVVAGPCPSLPLTTGAVQTHMRAGPSADFPVRVCETPLPAGAAAAPQSGLPLPVRPPRRIVVIGDTGCRVRVAGRFSEVQACNDPPAWSWAAIAEHAAAWHPDLVIHTGDVLYRESACPAGIPGCAGDPWGYRWTALHADFFGPAAPLLRAAPWIVVRGNHEDCERDGTAWFRFMDPRPVPPRCADYTAPYAVPLPGLRFLVLDSSYAGDLTAAPDRVAAYAAQFREVRRLAGSPAWLLTHKPLWAVGHAGEKDGHERLFFGNPTLDAAMGRALPSGVRLVLSGHVHLFEALGFTSGRPPQLVVGNGGTLLDPPLTTPLRGLRVGGTRIAGGRTVHRHGYLTLEAAAGEWRATVWDPAGIPVLTCTLRGRTLACPP